MKLGEKIKLLRSEANLTQPELAQKADIEQSYLSKLENDKANPSFEVIDKLAKVLGWQTMILIESLDRDYINNNLAHLPEVAAKIAEVKIQRHQKVKRRYLQATLMIAFGIASIIFGVSQSLNDHKVYEYYSEGVIKFDEPLDQFRLGNIHQFEETSEERKKRLIANRSRLNEKYLLLDTYMGEHYIADEEAGRRNFRKRASTSVKSTWGTPFIMLGVILLVCGAFVMNFVYSFRKG